MARFLPLVILAASLALAPLATAQAQRAPYGAPISLAQAEQVTEAALAEARRNNWNVAVAVVDGGGHLIAFKRMDSVDTAVVEIALGKAQTAAGFRQPSANIEGWARSNPAPLAIDVAMPVRGGLPIVVDGRTIGGVGVSGVASEQDEQIANAGLAALQR